jgi:sec-independent protein translocase protein TatA
MWRDLLQPSHLIIVAVLLVILFGWKKLPDAARSVGRSMRIFKSEVGEMKNDGKQSRPSAAAGETVPGDVVPPQTAQPTPPSQPAAQPQAAQPQAAAPQQPPVFQQTPAANGQSAQDATAEQQRHENPAL